MEGSSAATNIAIYVYSELLEKMWSWQCFASIHSLAGKSGGDNSLEAAQLPQNSHSVDLSLFLEEYPVQYKSNRFLDEKPDLEEDGALCFPSSARH